MEQSTLWRIVEIRGEDIVYNSGNKDIIISTAENIV